MRLPRRAFVVPLLMGGALMGSALMGFTSRLGAQTVRGLVTRTGTPVSGAVVQLLDSTSAIVSRTITDDAGAYRVLAPRPGSYRLAARRVGVAPYTSAVFVLRAGETREVALSVDGVAVSLDTMKVTSQRGCVLLTTANSEVATVWEQAKTALLATEATITQRAFSAALLGYRREFTPERGSSLLSMSMVEIDSVAQPWSSRPVSELRRTGYVVSGKDDSTSFLAPGLDVLTSNEFATDHCFRIVPIDDGASIGMTFEPAKPKRNIVEIRGTLRLDRSTSELRSLEFRYTNLLPAAEQAGAGGRLDFVRMRDGSWVISQWNIRMPVLSRTAVGGGRSLRFAERLAAVSIAGGDLFVARRGADTLWSRALPGVSGVVTDSVSGRAIAGARLRLRELDKSVLTDSAGRFNFGELMPGEYTMLVNTLSLDSLGAVSGLPILVSDSMSALAVRLPNAQRVWPAVCRIPADSVASQRGFGLVRGTVITDGGAPAPNADVLVQWVDSATQNVRSQRVTTDDIGRYRVCGVPLSAPLDVRADGNLLSSRVASLRIDAAAPFATLDLALQAMAPDQAVLRGDVLDLVGTPLDNAVVELPQLKLRAVTDAKGAFRIPQVPAGKHLLTVRRLGFSPVDSTIEVTAGVVAEERFVLRRVTTLAGVNTTASRALMREFDENRKLGLGQFRTREELAKQEAQRLSEVMTMMRGVRIVRVPVSSGRTISVLSSARGQRSLTSGQCFAQVYLDNTPLYLGRPNEPLFDLNELLVLQIEAIQYFAGASETPSKYSSLNSDCGVVVIHTRQTP